MNTTPGPPWLETLGRWAPGVTTLARYRPRDLPHDLIAGLSVAAVALPVGVAYAQLAGFDPVIGLYSSMLPLLVYALFGTSRQLVVGPDAATCALIAASVAPLAGGDPALYLSLSMALTLVAGVLCIAASQLRLGALADFLSRPILVGFLNGIALHIILGQVGKLCGLTLDAPGIIPRTLEFLHQFGATHWPTLALSAATGAVLILLPRWLPRLPVALVAIVAAALVVALGGLDAQGVAVVGAVPAGLPAFGLPAFPLDLAPEILASAAGIALMSFTSTMLTARSFAAKNHYEIDVDREFTALGAANIASALTQGFAISGADSRTAMSDAAGGRTQLTGIVSAAVIALVLVFLTEPLRFVPIAALAAVLIKASVSLMDFASLKRFWRLDRHELGLCLLATFGVVWVGAINAILICVVLALLRFVKSTARPRVAQLGLIKGQAGFHDTDEEPAAQTIPGLVLWRFHSALVFFNAPYFKREALKAITAGGPALKWFVLDILPITDMDVTGLDALQEVRDELHLRGAELVIAGQGRAVMRELDRLQLPQDFLADRYLPTLRQALRTYRAELGGGAATPAKSGDMR
ncbi:SulP family inorganic anion transporter [uncultured Thiodictyon sp.]|uniref:SulP family inorganic anion transporter n=1 Tax=uncultured Thiodictyon sp. TaxID=1846217 RepID=UPI0025F9EC51|nr:SulP family inorganic anion transporter [uncultured Thiodictyon sp.]